MSLIIIAPTLLPLGSGPYEPFETGPNGQPRLSTFGEKLQEIGRTGELDVENLAPEATRRLQSRGPFLAG